jgi:hypothetical protein
MKRTRCRRRISGGEIKYTKRYKLGELLSTITRHEDFAKYLYLPRLKAPAVVLDAIREGLRLLTWGRDSFAYADSFDEVDGRYRGLRCGEVVNISEDNLSGLWFDPMSRSSSARPRARRASTTVAGGGGDEAESGSTGGTTGPAPQKRPKRFTAPSSWTLLGLVAMLAGSQTKSSPIWSGWWRLM